MRAISTSSDDFLSQSDRKFGLRQQMAKHQSRVRSPERAAPPRSSLPPRPPRPKGACIEKVYVEFTRKAAAPHSTVRRPRIQNTLIINLFLISSPFVLRRIPTSLREKLSLFLFLKVQIFCLTRNINEKKSLRFKKIK